MATFHPMPALAAATVVPMEFQNRFAGSPGPECDRLSIEKSDKNRLHLYRNNCMGQLFQLPRIDDFLCWTVDLTTIIYAAFTDRP
ncbi:MAG: hypothetical protein ACREEV_00065 [Dongiaceae bacterium]